MAGFDERTVANMGIVLEETFEGVPHGETMRAESVSQKSSYLQGAKNVTLDGLRAVARDALSRHRSGSQLEIRGGECCD